MLPSLAQLQKYLQTEIGAKYTNRAVIGGLPKMLSFWEPNALRDGVPAEIVSSLASRIRAYPDQPVDKRPVAIAELLDLVNEANATAMAQKRAAAGPAPGRAASAGAAPERRPPARPETPPADAPSPQPASVAPIPEARRPEPPATPAAGARPPDGRPAPPAQPAAGTRPPDGRPAGKPGSKPGSKSGAKPKPAQPEPSRRRPDLSPMQIEPVDPRPRRTTGPKPLRAAEPADPQAPLEAPLTVLRGVGPETAKELARLGLNNLGDLLRYLPRRYDNYARMRTINRLEYGEECSLVATVQSVQERRFKGGRTMLTVVLSDGTGSLQLAEFRTYLKNTLLTPGRQVVVSGRVEQYLGRLTFRPTDWEKLDVELLNTGRIVPVYGLTEGVHQRTLRNLSAQVVNFWARRQADPVPAPVVERAGLLAYGEALAQVHFPDSEASLEAAQHRLAFDELLVLQLGVLRQRRRWQSAAGRPLPLDEAAWERFQGSLPYGLTNAQQRAVAELRADLARSVPMNRMLQGDVGSGKTVVAAAGIVAALQAGAQAALMAPTSILAEQHFRSLSRLLAGVTAPGELRLLQGATPAAEKDEIYAGLRSGSVRAVVGTHALLEDPVEFAALGLAVVDEQHRFGVGQRAALRAKGGAFAPHLLVMTATPIPRTLALSIYGDLDLSVLDEMPPGRQPITTYLLHANERERAYHFVRREVQKGRQAFLIFPLVEESDQVEARAAVDEHQRLQASIFPDLRLGLLHGRLRPDDKDDVMARFHAGEFHILVSTSVVEVGVDVPNASVILIDGANRFGLAQLHQFRGRVGRGEHASYCLLVSDAPTVQSDERLRAMESTQDGFVLAQKDLELRGPGAFLGTRQSGFAELSTAPLSDVLTVEKARREARQIFDQDPDLEAPEHAALAGRVREFWSGGAGDVS